MNEALLALGYSAYFEEAWQKLPEEERSALKPARVVGQHRREWDVKGHELLSRAYLAGKRWAKGSASDEAQPTIGDWVLVREARDGGLPVIEHILPRKTSLVRAAAGGRGDRQVVAANVDLVLMVSALTPEEARADALFRSINPRRLERYLTAIESGGAQALFVLNKCDLHSDAESIAAELRARLGREVICTSTKTERGIEPLHSVLKSGETVGFIGMSGVGKSSLVNALFGHEIQKVRSERTSDARGRHTTTHRELFALEGGSLLIDTPGMREFALSDADETDLASFSDITELARSCRFADCQHGNEPGCAVRPAVLAGEILPDRLAHYGALRREVAGQATVRKGSERKPVKTKRPK